MDDMNRISLLLKILVLFIIYVRSSAGSCYSFALGNIGYLYPADFPYVEEGTTLHLECVLERGFAENNSLTADDISWFRVKPTYGLLSPLSDARVNLSTRSNETALFNMRNISVSDDGEYACAVNVNGTLLRICTVEIPVAGPPKKYLDFKCESQNYMNLICSWKRAGYYGGRSKTRFTLKYRTEAGPNEYDCPKLTSSTRDDFFKCEWNATLMKNPPLMIQYTHFLLINGTNSFSSLIWHETVTPALLVRPAPPGNLTTVNYNRNSCTLQWDISGNLQGTFQKQMGIQAQVDYAKVENNLDDEDLLWQSAAGNIDKQQYQLSNLDSYSNYSVRVRIHPTGGNGYWSDYNNISCATLPARPDGSVGTVSGAYEEVGNGGQRRVTLYWQGIPEHLRNGPDFRYKLIARNGQGESRDLGETVFANYFIAAPANSSFYVDVIPVNQEGEGIKETTIVAAVRDYPLMIQRANVVKFAMENMYEVSWEANRPADTFDLFWCPTSLLPHLAKCTDTMSHVTVNGDLNAYNLTLDPSYEYRFAVAGRDGSSLSGMTWIARMCSSNDRHARLEGLIVTPRANASVDLQWDVPCQHRFLNITGYRIFYYICDATSPKDCSPDRYTDVFNRTTLSLQHLHPGRRYCFLLMVLDEVNSPSLLVHKVEQCITTTQLSPPLPLGSIIGGSVAGAIFLVALAFCLWRLIKRMRNDFNEIQKQSRIIHIPPVMFDKYDDGYDQDRTHYTKVDLDMTDKFYTRQLSNISSSGHGSISSEDVAQSSRVSASDMEGDQGNYQNKRVDLISGLSGTRVAVFPTEASRPKHRHSTFDLDNLSHVLANKLRNSPDTVSLGSSDNSYSGNATKPKPQPRNRHGRTMHITAPSEKTSSVLRVTATDSGISDSQASSGYVAASALSPSSVITTQTSLGTATDPGYTSQKSNLSDSLNGSETSVFSELDSPTRSSKAERSDYLEQEKERLDYAGSKGSLNADNETRKNDIRPETVPVASGYVAWPQ